MTEAIGVVYGGSLFVAMNALVAYVAHVVGRRLLPTAGLAARLTASGLTFLAIIVLLAQGLSIFGLYNREVVALAVAGLAVLVNRAWGPHADIRGDTAALWHSAREAASSRGAVLLVMAAVAFGVSTWRAVVQTPMGWDSLTYHLPFAASYVQTGRLETLVGPLVLDAVSHYPKNAEILASWLMLPFHGDLVVGLMNVALLAIAWMAVVALGRALDVSKEDAALAATAVCASPFLFSFTTTQDADPLVFVASMGSLVFFVRYLSSGAGVDAFLSLSAVGLAVGTKYSALPAGAMVLGGVALAGALGLRQASRGPGPALWILVGLLAVGALGARQYVLNVADTGNPFYPMTFRLGAIDPLPASPYTDWLVEEVGVGDRRADRSALLAVFHYYPSWSLPTSGGPKYLIFVALTVVALLRSSGHRARLMLALVTIALVGFAATMIPEAGFAALHRRFWTGIIARLVGASLGVIAVAGISTLATLTVVRRDLLRGLIVAFVLWDLMVSSATLTARFPVLIGLALLAAVVATPRLWIDRRRAVGLAALSFLAVVVVGFPILAAHRAATRWMALERSDEVDVVPKAYLDGWRFIDGAGPRLVAFATGVDWRGQNWFTYPLMGGRLQNTVTYVPLNQSDPPGSRAYVRRENARFPEWVASIEQRRVQLVCVQQPWPIEDEWMRENPERFALVFGDPNFRAYETRARRPAATRQD